VCSRSKRWNQFAEKDLLKMRLTKQQLKDAISTIYDGLSQGLTDNEVADEMGITLEEYEELKIAMFDAKTQELRSRPYEHVYVEYMLAQAANLRDLTSVIDKMHSSNQYQSLVGAVRARADILDRLITKGQEFGIIHKKTERKEIVAGVIVSQLSDPQLKKLILGELSVLNDMRKKFGEKDISLLEPPTEIYTGPVLEEFQNEEFQDERVSQKKTYEKGEIPKGAKAKTNKISKGRKKIKKPALLLDI